MTKNFDRNLIVQPNQVLIYVQGCLLYQQAMQKEWKEHFIKYFLLKTHFIISNKQVDVGGLEKC